ncbi:MAG TPA: hypothetical protein VEP46_15935, partial [Vicinamibacterales bacterium]|nr:hypothetical protein [Vicinamibacterales bacterium]
AEGSQGSEFAGSQVRGTSGAGEGLRGADGPRSFGRVFVLRNGEFVPVRVRTGVSDGAMTAIVDGDLKEGDQVVTGMSQPGATAQTGTTSPLIPFGRRGGGANANRGAAAGAGVASRPGPSGPGAAGGAGR